jgi:hypothetical protein
VAEDKVGSVDAVKTGEVLRNDVDVSLLVETEEVERVGGRMHEQ